MRKLLLGGVALLTCCALTGSVDATDHRNDGCCEPCAMPGAGAVSFVEQKVTAYRCEVKTRTVQRDVMKMVTKQVEEAYTFIECVASTTPEKRMETVCRLVTKEVPFSHMVTVPVVTPEKRKVTVMTSVPKEVPFTYTVQVPHITPQKVKQTVYTCVPEEVVRQVPVCRMVSERVVDPCTGCAYTVCRPTTEMQTVKGTVMKHVPSEREVEVNVCTYTTEERKGTRIVMECVPQEREVVVHTCRYEQQERKGTRIVCETVSEQREVTVNVVRYQNVEKKGTRLRTVCEWVKETVPVTETYTEMVPYETTVRVPVYSGAPCYTPCYSAPRGGLFGRGRLCSR